MRLGFHVSVRKGVLGALEETTRLGCETLQIFPRRPGNPMRFPDDPEAAKIRRVREERRISPLVVHSVYQPNIASTNAKIWKRSSDSFRDELRFADTIGAEYLVIHSGSFSPGSSLAEGIRRSAGTIREVLGRQAPGTKILIENVAGGERRIGGKFEELKALMEEIGQPDRVGICLDTAHCYAAGYAIETARGLEDCLSRFDRTVGLEKIDLFHFNDSGAGLGSHKDIHVHIGKGEIGTGSLRSLARDARFQAKTGILETPRTSREDDLRNLNLLTNG